MWKLWIYTNYDCNLRCSYCVAESSPHAPRRAIGLETAQRLIDEAVALDCGEVFFTGGEPFILPEIYAMLAYASARLPTTVLTNAMLLHGKRLEQLCAVANEKLTIQVSLDGASAADHDAYRGAGSWQKTIAGIERLLERQFRVRLSTTETPANQGRIDAICALHRAWGIPEEDHIVRALVRRGFSAEGIELTPDTLIPELTVNRDGVFWHPLSTDHDMLVTPQIFPLADAYAKVQDLIAAQTRDSPRTTFT